MERRRRGKNEEERSKDKIEKEEHKVRGNFKLSFCISKTNLETFLTG